MHLYPQPSCAAPILTAETAANGFDRDFAWKYTDQKWTADQDKDLFLDLLRKMVVGKPSARGPVEQLLFHPFFEGHDMQDSGTDGVHDASGDEAYENDGSSHNEENVDKGEFLKET